MKLQHDLGEYMIQPHLLTLLRCLNCTGELVAQTDDVLCTACNAHYPVSEGVLCMTPGNLGAQAGDEEKLAEQRTRDAQSAQYDRMLAWHLPSRMEIPRMLALLGQGHDAILEVGAGTGRMSRSLARRCRRLVAVDLSLASLQRNRRTLMTDNLADNVLHLQADATALPVRSAAFQAGFSAQLLEHLPLADLREALVRSLSQAVAPGGPLVLSAYLWSWMYRMMGPREGHHPGGIYYYRYTVDEMRDLLQRNYGAVDYAAPHWQYLVIARAHNRLGRDERSSA